MTRWTTRAGYVPGLRAALTDGGPATDPPAGVVEWMARLRLLTGVPFFYLVPEGRMLPPESIRFFQVDPNWVDVLLDGAFSVGRSTTGDATRDQARAAVVFGAAKAASRTVHVRRRAAAAAHTSWVSAAVAARDAALAAASRT
ncbi:MAG TPA: hypothetical protein VGV85_06465, partial [Longimicrobiaceae bacterium]|nr:hypothetical protein [Longimicrobiaceae bacterium]